MEKRFKVNTTVYQRHRKYGVGKEMGGKIYVHKKYFDRVINPDTFFKAVNKLPYGFKFNCLMIDPKKKTIRFDEAPDFDTAREPHPGDFIEVNFMTKEIRRGHSDMVWHHKWMWVDDDYDGFDVDESYAWSKKWTSYITHPTASKKLWEQQLERAGVNK